MAEKFKERLEAVYRADGDQAQLDGTYDDWAQDYEHDIWSSGNPKNALTIGLVERYVGVILRAKEDGVLDGLNLKLAKVGGISKMRLIRDLCVALHVPMEIQDSSYSELACAVIAHMGHSTPNRCIRSVIYAKGLKKTTVENAPAIIDGRMIALDLPGIGARPIMDAIGEPVAVYG